MISTTRTFAFHTRAFSLFMCAALVISLLLPAATSLAGTINYVGPDTDPNGMNGWMGDTVWYTAVSESNTEDPNGGAAMLFGAPTAVTGDSIDFDPMGFQAKSDATTGHAADITDGQLNFMVQAKELSVIENIKFLERGDTTLAGIGTDFTSTAVFANIFVDVIEIDGAPAPGAINLTTSMVFTPSDGDYGLLTDGGGGPVFNTAWSGEGMIDINAELDLLGIPYTFGATKVNVAIDNTLVATSENGNSSFIQKKDADGVTITTNIPEPTTALLLLSGLLAGVASRRRS